MNRTERSGRGTADVCAPHENPEDEDAFWRFFARKLAPYLPAELTAAKGEDWIDQRNSPLGRRRHNELARKGAFPAHPEGRLWRALRADVDAYIRSHPQGGPLDPRPANDRAPVEDEDPEVRALLADHGLDLTPKRRARGGEKR